MGDGQRLTTWIEWYRFMKPGATGRISFADLGSTSGWLIPSWYAKEIWKIIVEQTWSIGTVGQSPAFMGVRLVKPPLP